MIHVHIIRRTDAILRLRMLIDHPKQNTGEIPDCRSYSALVDLNIRVVADLMSSGIAAQACPTSCIQAAADT